MEKHKKGEKLYIVRSHVFARSGAEALKKAKGMTPHEAFVDSDWEKNNINTADAIGFRTETESDTW